MAFVTGLMIVDAPASALNNLGSIPGSRTDNTSGVKHIRTREGAYPYVSAQAFRYWLRSTLEERVSSWIASPVYREEKVAYTDANPIRYWDDDLLGYMRAPSKKVKEKVVHKGATTLEGTITRISPFRVGTLVSLAPVRLVEDFGVMARQDGDPVPFEHQFYRATLKGLFSLNLKTCGTFWYRNKTGFRNLDAVRMEEAKESGLVHLEEEKAYRLSLPERIKRIVSLFEGLAQLEGGAKQTLHYTDVSPVVVLLAVTKGGNHIFNHVIQADSIDLPVFNPESMEQILKVFGKQILSPVFVGWVKGYREEEFRKIESFGAAEHDRVSFIFGHPREAFLGLAHQLEENPDLLG